MRHSFNPFARSLAGLACCMALGLTASTCVAARGAVVAQSTPNPQVALLRWLSSGLIIDWNIDCFTGRGPVVDNLSREPMPALLPGADLADEPVPAADEAAAGKDAASSPAADTSPAEDGGYMEYKYGHYGSYYGNKFGVNPATPQSRVGADDCDNNSGNDDASMDDGAGVADESAMADDSTSSNTEDKDGDTADAKVGDVATESDRADADETDPTPETGNDAMDGSDEGSDVADGAAKTAANDEQSPGETASDDCFRMTLAEAFAAVISNYADELSARYGLATSGVARLFGWEW